MHNRRSKVKQSRRAPSQGFARVMFRNRDTFKPIKRANEGTRRYQLHKYAEATLGAGDLREAVRLPVGEDLNDWRVCPRPCAYPMRTPCAAVHRFAVNVTDFFNEISLLYASPMKTASPFPILPLVCIAPRLVCPGMVC